MYVVAALWLPSRKLSSLVMWRPLCSVDSLFRVCAFISMQVWFDRRTNYTRSLAVMSMVGYILGLGDRYDY